MLNGTRLSSLVTVAAAAVPVGAAAAPTGTAGGDEAPAASGCGSFAAALERAQVAADEPARRSRPAGPTAGTGPAGHPPGPTGVTLAGEPPRPVPVGANATTAALTDGRPTAIDLSERRADETGPAAADEPPFAAAGEALHGPCPCPVAGEPAPAAPATGASAAVEVPAGAGAAASAPNTVASAALAEPSTGAGAADAASRGGTSPLGHPARSTRHVNAGRAAHDAAASASATDRPAPAPTSGSVADPSRPAPPPLAGATGSTAALAPAAAAAAAAAAEIRGEAVTATAAPGATAAGAGAGTVASAEPVAGGAPASTPEPTLQPALGAPAAAPAAAPGTPAAVPGWHESRLAAAVDTPHFAPALGAQLSVLVRDGVQQARLHLNPAEMGPIAVQISLEGTAARIEMVAEHALTRQVLEQAMPVLAGALRDSGLTLAGGGVFEQPRRPPEGAMAERGPATQGLAAADGEAPAAMAMPARRLLGALDVYA